MANSIKLKVNGRQVARQVDDQTLLVHFIRDTLGLTGTHVGCDTGQCGACTIHLDGRAVKSCTVLAAQASGSEVTTTSQDAKSASSAAARAPLSAAVRFGSRSWTST